MGKFFDMDGQPMELDEWAVKFEDMESRVVGRTDLPGGILVSTVWLGLDHNLDGAGPPLIFETMVFGRNGQTLDVRRYSTLEQAAAGHAEMVEAFLHGAS